MKKELLTGEIRSLREAEKNELEGLTEFRTNPADIVAPELAERAGKLASKLSAQIALLVGRDGRIISVIVGTRERVYLPDLGRFRVDPGRLRALRLIVFVPSERYSRFAREHSPLEPRNNEARGVEFIEALAIPQDLLSDLEKLRLDSVLVVAVRENGECGPISLAYLERQTGGAQGKVVPSSHRGIVVYYGTSLEDISIHFRDFVMELEALFTAARERSTELPSGKAILVGAYTGSLADARASMDELQELARTAGVEVVDIIVQRRRVLDPRTVVGKGKIEQLMLHGIHLGADLLIFDRELSPGQLRSITSVTEMKVLDRSMLILDIFAQRAKSREGRLQVELAQLRYSLPRLTEKDSGLSRLTGGIGGRGPGETKLEISRRRARDRIADLEKRIEKIADERQLRRNRRQERGVPVVAIVGYTNSGKSTLLNAMTKSDVLAESKLFATLDPSSRRMRFPNDREVIFVDTVGFIRELPKELVSAFRATLEEVGEADLLVHLVDATNPEREHQIEVVLNTLASLGFAERRRILVWNKVDMLSEAEVRALSASYDSLAISAQSRQGFSELLERIQGELRESFAGQDPGRFLEMDSPPDEAWSNDD